MKSRCSAKAGLWRCLRRLMMSFLDTLVTHAAELLQVAAARYTYVQAQQLHDRSVAVDVRAHVTTARFKITDC